jgi:hypothetical protein
MMGLPGFLAAPSASEVQPIEIPKTQVVMSTFFIRQQIYMEIHDIVSQVFQQHV